MVAAYGPGESRYCDLLKFCAIGGMLNWLFGCLTLANRPCKSPVYHHHQ
jgi:hypothetical protein